MVSTITVTGGDITDVTWGDTDIPSSDYLTSITPPGPPAPVTVSGGVLDFSYSIIVYPPTPQPIYINSGGIMDVNNDVTTLGSFVATPNGSSSAPDIMSTGALLISMAVGLVIFHRRPSVSKCQS
jgi:hypothetical protein